MRSQKLKILGVVALIWIASMVGSALGPQLLTCVLIPTIFILLMMFPGKDPENPRLFKVTPWIWSLSFLSAVTLLLADLFEKDLFGQGTPKPSNVELAGAVITYLPLMWTFLRRHPLFKPVLIGATVISLGTSIYAYLESTREFDHLIDMWGSLIAEGILVPYLFIKFKPRQTGTLAHEEAKREKAEEVGKETTSSDQT